MAGRGGRAPQARPEADRTLDVANALKLECEKLKHGHGSRPCLHRSVVRPRLVKVPSKVPTVAPSREGNVVGRRRAQSGSTAAQPFSGLTAQARVPRHYLQHGSVALQGHRGRHGFRGEAVGDDRAIGPRRRAYRGCERCEFSAQPTFRTTEARTSELNQLSEKLGRSR